MRRNRKRTRRMSVVASHTMHVFGVMIVLFAMVIINMLASSSCTQLRKSIGEKERMLKSLEKDRVRESARWDSLQTIDRLEKSLMQLGLNMKYAKPVQIIRMDARGVPLLAQNSVKEALRRQGAVETAQVKPAAPAPAVRASAPVRVRGNRRARR